MYMLRTTTKQIQQVCVDPCTSDHSIRRCPLAVALWRWRQIIDRHLPPANQLRVAAAIDRRDRQTDIDAYRYKRAASCNSNTQITKQRLLLLPLSVVSAIDSALSDSYETSAIAQ